MNFKWKEEKSRKQKMIRRNEMPNYVGNINWYKEAQNKTGWKNSGKTFIQQWIENG